MELDKWVAGYKVRSFPWIDGKHIYFNVQYYAPGQSIEQSPVWDKSVYIVDNAKGRRLVHDFTHSLTEHVAKIQIENGKLYYLDFEDKKSITYIEVLKRTFEGKTDPAKNDDVLTSKYSPSKKYLLRYKYAGSDNVMNDVHETKSLAEFAKEQMLKYNIDCRAENLQSEDLPTQEKQDNKGGIHIMDENSNMAQNAASSAPLMENQYVKELFSILQDNGRDSSGLSALLGHVSEMENFVKRAEDRIAEMKSQLADMKEVQNHPVKTALQNAIKSLENKVAAVKEHLSELKHNIVEGCKNAVAAFKEKGITALDKFASFFHIKQGLQDWKKDIDSIIRTDDKAVAKIEAFASEYHTAGRAIKNMARVAVGKQPIDAKKEAGKLAKTLAAPYKAQKAALTGLRKSIDKAIAKLDRLETTAAKQADRAAEKKPSMLAKLSDNKERVEREKRELPTPERTKAQAVEV